jgi:CubicO group peptidase (beta-lactamase class C family)
MKLSLTWFTALGAGSFLFVAAAPSAGCGSSNQATAGDAAANDAGSPDTALDATPTDPRITQLLSAATAAVQADGVVGAGIAVVVDGQLAYTGGIGAQSIGGPAVDGDTLFLVGSTTKMLTAATVMSLVEEGKLDLQAPLTTYLPQLTVESPFDVHDIRLSRLLSHSDGLEDNSAAQCALPRFSAYGQSGPVTLWGTPGTFFDYSNNDMVLAAQAIEAVTGAGSFEQTVHDRVFSPAGMTSATFDALAATQSANVAKGYLADAAGAFTTPITIALVAAACPLAEPAGFAIASARDFGSFVQTMLAHGGSMLQPASVQAMETGVIATGWHPSADETYGYALFIDQIGGETVINHAGDVPPFHSLVFFVPSANFGFVMLINSDSPKTLSEVATRALTIFSPPPTALAQPIRTSPSAWADYTGRYADTYGRLGSFSLSLQDASLAAFADDGGLVGTLTQIDGDYWALLPSGNTGPALGGFFWRDDAGVVTQVVTRAGVPVRVSAGPIVDAATGD